MSASDILTQLQFVIISCLGTETISGEELRNRLKTKGVLRTGPGFYQMMGRIEETGLVEGDYASVQVGNRKMRERRYNVSGMGVKAFNRTVDFYNVRIPGLGGVGHA